MPTNFHAAAVRFGKPGLLYVAATTVTTEPTDTVTAYAAGYVPMGYTADGSSFNYNISVDNVDVAEELDVFARVTTGRDASVEVALAEMTKRNLTIAFNGGVVLGDATAWSFEPPDLGTETRVRLAWDAQAIVANNDLRWLFRQALQTNSLGITNRKGTEKSVLSMTFGLEKPISGAKVLKILGTAATNPSDS